jgi:hypothetical protein
VTTWLRDAGFEGRGHLLLDPDDKDPRAILFTRRRA